MCPLSLADSAYGDTKIRREHHAEHLDTSTMSLSFPVKPASADILGLIILFVFDGPPNRQ